MSSVPSRHGMHYGCMHLGPAWEPLLTYLQGLDGAEEFTLSEAQLALRTAGHEVEKTSLSRVLLGTQMGRKVHALNVKAGRPESVWCKTSPELEARRRQEEDEARELRAQEWTARVQRLETQRQVARDQRAARRKKSEGEVQKIPVLPTLVTASMPIDEGVVTISGDVGAVGRLLRAWDAWVSRGACDSVGDTHD